MTTFKDFTRGQSKLRYLSFFNSQNIDRYCQKELDQNPLETVGENRKKIEHPIVALTERLQDVMHGNEVPHPVLFPCDELFTPAMNSESRIRTLLEAVYQLGHDYDSALIGSSQQTFEKLNRGEFPLMSFKAKFMVFPVYLNPRFYEEQMRQRVETIMYYSRLSKRDVILSTANCAPNCHIISYGP